MRLRLGFPVIAAAITMSVLGLRLAELDTSGRFSLLFLSPVFLSPAEAASAPAASSADTRPPEVVALSARDLEWLNRITWGINPSSAKEFAALGPDKYLERQLHPPNDVPLPREAQAQIDALAISHTPMQTFVADMDQESRTANAITDPDQRQAAQKAYQDSLARFGREPAIRSVLRDLYSPYQLREQLTWFWLNHFNVHLYKSNIRLLIGDYEDRAIRPHALGRFRDLLAATLRHPAMLRYLDNDQNAVGHINENYAREIMELHTMAVGSGYTQNDVQELARILTGAGVNQSLPQSATVPKLPPERQGQYVRDGLFEFNPNRHDYGDKIFLGHTIKGRGLAEIDEALDLLARAPATARFISHKLAVYFVSDNPSPQLVDKMAATFRQTDGDIAAVLKAMFTAPEFKASLGMQFKDPMHYIISAVRLAYDDKVILNTGPIQGWLGRMAEPLYGHETPDGYPLTEAAWNGPGQMATRFEIARAIGSGSAGLFKGDSPQAVDQPAFPQPANALYFNSLRQTLGASTLQALDKAISPQDWNTLFLASPEFMRR
ncbi:MAG TPA: DUF1800 domain-containing protein [Xanthobacteraceae bacterium]|jgi:uncharacterized protein (DUF1800 family)|nr:DUF1800 domain-containing protein [Xanthobacteraceae bacterium]